MNQLHAAKVVEIWAALIEELGAPLKGVRSAEDLQHAIELLDSLLSITVGDPDHALQPLVELVSDQIEQFESATLENSDASPADMLKLLMESNGLSQSELAPLVGGQSVVSAILNGRRNVNARQAAKLAARFGVSPALFIAKIAPAAPARPSSAVPERDAGKDLWAQNIVLGKDAFHRRRGRQPKRVATLVGCRRENVVSYFEEPALRAHVNSITVSYGAGL